MRFHFTKRTLALFGSWIFVGIVAQSQPMAAGGVFAIIVVTPVAIAVDLWRIRQTTRRMYHQPLRLPPPLF